MKNRLYYLDESEKMRILNLHENHKKNIIIEVGGFDSYKPSQSSSVSTVTPENLADSLIKILQGIKGNIFQYFEMLLSQTSLGLPDKTKESIQAWLQYPCVINSMNVVPSLLTDKSIVFTGGGHYWYGNGRNMSITNRTMGDYHCGPDGKVAAGTQDQSTPEESFGDEASGPVSSPVSDNQSTSGEGAPASVAGNSQSTDSNSSPEVKQNTVQPEPNFRVQYNVLTPDKLKQVRDKSGSKSTGNKLSQEDVNSIYSIIEKL